MHISASAPNFPSCAISIDMYARFHRAGGNWTVSQGSIVCLTNGGSRKLLFQEKQKTLGIPTFQGSAVFPGWSDNDASFPPFTVLPEHEVIHGHHESSHVLVSVGGSIRPPLKEKAQLVRHSTQKRQAGVRKSATGSCMVPLLNEVGDPADVTTKQPQISALIIAANIYILNERYCKNSCNNICKTSIARIIARTNK